LAFSPLSMSTSLTVAPSTPLRVPVPLTSILFTGASGGLGFASSEHTADWFLSMWKLLPAGQFTSKLFDRSASQ